MPGLRVPHLSLGDRRGSFNYKLNVMRGRMVRPERFELPACCFGGNRSIQLSYGRAGETVLGYHLRCGLGNWVSW